jgi:integrase
MATKNKVINKVYIQTNSNGYYQYQIPGIYAKPIWGKKQKYISFGAINNGDPVVAAEAKNKLALLNKDLEEGIFDPDNFDKYKHVKNQVKFDYARKQKVTLLELFDDYTEYRFTTDVSKVGKLQYQRKLRPVLVKCPFQDLTSNTSQREIQEFISNNTSYSAAEDLFSILSKVVQRAISKGILNQNNPNTFKDYLKEYKSITTLPSKKYPKYLLLKGKLQDTNKIAWTKNEMNIIIEALRNRKKASYYYRKCDVLTLTIEFLFYTGMRHGEAFGLKWNALSEDLSQVYIHESYNSKYKVQKNTKTGKNRKINLSIEAQNILIKLKSFYQEIGWKIEPNSYVFLNPSKNLIRADSLQVVWTGCLDNKTKKYSPGVVMQLVLDGKLNNYIEAYSTRRTFVSLMAQKHDAKTVADYIGDNVETIFKHYYSGKENFTPDFSF